MKFRPGMNISPSKQMPTLVLTRSPVPRPYSPSPIYSQRLPTPMQKPKPHIMPIKKADMIPSYSATPTIRPSHTPLLTQTPIKQEDSLIIPGALGLLIFFLIMWVISKVRIRKQKTKAEMTTSELIIQQINPTAYSKLNLIRRASSNSLNSSGNISPV